MCAAAYEASSYSSLLLLLPALYPPTKVNFISLHFVLADKPVIPDRHNKPKTYNLKPQVVKLHSNSCCTDTNNFPKLIKNPSNTILTNHEISKFGAVQ